MDEALANFTEAINLDKNCFAAILQRGTLYRAIGQRKDALADLTNALNIARNDIKGLALEERGSGVLEDGTDTGKLGLTSLKRLIFLLITHSVV